MKRTTLRALGRRAPDGTVEAREIEARPNGMALFEKQVLRLTDEAESKYRRAGRFYTSGRQSRTVGKLRDAGPEVARVRRIVERVAPPYVDAGRVQAGAGVAGSVILPYGESHSVWPL